MAERKTLYYPEEIIPIVDEMLVKFAEDLASEKLLPVEFTQRMLGAMSLASRMKDLMRGDGGNNG